MLVKYHSSDNIKAPFEDFALGLQNAWAGPEYIHSISIKVYPDCYPDCYVSITMS